MQNGAILPVFYLPPVAYFTCLVQNKENILLEKFEHFPKQTYRNRASIQSPNGKLDLFVPVIKGSKVHTPIKDVKISYDFNWQRLHWMSLETCYRSSAYFEYYEDDLAPFYNQKWDYLFEYNEALLKLLTKCLKLNINYSYTESYEKEYVERLDMRNAINPKMNLHVETKKYFQVFEDRNGFMPNLSVVDLLFSQGPQSRQYL